MTVYDLAKRNYGRTWTKEMLAMLVVKALLTEAEYEEVTGEPYNA